MKKNLLAELTKITLPPIGGDGFGPFGNINWGENEAGATRALTSFTSVISNIIGVLTIVAGIWFMFQFITAGISWISAGGNKESVAGARDRMRNALIGMVVVVAAWAIVGLMGNLLGIDILIQDPGKLIEQLRPPR